MRMCKVKVITCNLLISFIALLNHFAFSYEITSAGEALEYLSHFGYLNNIDSNPKVLLEDAREAVREFQDFAHIIPNGKLNSHTLKKMNKPRCGNRDLRVFEGDEIGIDFGLNGRSRRRKRYDSPGVRWHKRVLTYRITRFASSNLNPKMLQKEVDLAFKYWEREANLTFKKIWEGKPDIQISFVRGDHGDEESFDGPSKTLAHAFYPAVGEIHFDDDEKWTANARHGHNLRTVAVHEIGHALGLGHSREKKSVMYLMYQGFKEKLQLHVTDVNAIQNLYGPKIKKDSVKNQNEVLKPSQKIQKLDGMISNSASGAGLCLNTTIDAITTLADGLVYVFKDDYYYRFQMGKPIDFSKYPKRINETFKGLPSNLDTILSLPNGKTYFFKGKHYWRLTFSSERQAQMDRNGFTNLDDNYPKKISTNFLGIPNHLDASFIWSWNSKVYFFKRDRYWRYDFETPNKRAVPVTSPPKKSPGKTISYNDIIVGYPKRISSNWPGIPDGIEDAFLAPNGRSYFFKKGQYWQFHNVDSDQEAASYPRPTGEYWFGCSNFRPDGRKIRHVRKRKPYIYV